MERQRKVHSEERDLWHIERKELEEKIVKLEVSLQRYQAISSSQATSPIDKSGSAANSSFWTLLGTGGSRGTSTSSTGDEVWRGPKIDVQPTRTFSGSLTQPHKSGDRLPSIAENAHARNRKEISEHSTDKQGAPHKPSINGADIDKNLDGITFKTGRLAPGVVKNIMTPQSPSPVPASPSKVSPVTMSLLSNALEAPEDILTKDAGHTPLARRSYFNNDGPGSTDAETPTQPELERPPLEPHTTAVKLPSERSDSYFPPVPDEPEPIGNEDPELKGPLGLTNDASADNKFLSALDSKLEQAAKSSLNSLDSPAVAGASSNTNSDHGGGDDDVPEFEQPDHEPRLRIKRSINFGSAFGSKSCGRGI